MSILGTDLRRGLSFKVRDIVALKRGGRADFTEGGILLRLDDYIRELKKISKNNWGYINLFINPPRRYD